MESAEKESKEWKRNLRVRRKENYSFEGELSEREFRNLERVSRKKNEKNSEVGNYKT